MNPRCHAGQTPDRQQRRIASDQSDHRKQLDVAGGHDTAPPERQQYDQSKHRAKPVNPHHVRAGMPRLPADPPQRRYTDTQQPEVRDTSRNQISQYDRHAQQPQQCQHSVSMRRRRRCCRSHRTEGARKYATHIRVHRTADDHRHDCGEDAVLQCGDTLLPGQSKLPSGLACAICLHDSLPREYSIPLPRMASRTTDAFPQSVSTIPRYSTQTRGTHADLSFGALRRLPATPMR